MNPDFRIEVSCPECAKRGIEKYALRSSGVLLTILDSDRGHYYTFFCPGCHIEISKPATSVIMKLLVGHVRQQIIHVPKEMLESRDGPQLTTDDLLDFLGELYEGSFRVSDDIYDQSTKTVKAMEL